MNNRKRILHIALMLLVVTAFAPSANAKENAEDIRLVLQLTVDGLRADLLARYSDRFTEDGFMLL